MSTVDAILRAVGTRPRRWLLAVTLLLGLLAAAGVSAGLSPSERTFAELSDPVQSLMSVVVAWLGSLLARDLRRAPSRPATGRPEPATGGLAPTLLAATLLAAAIGIAGILFCAATLAVAATGPDPWRDAATIAVGSVLVQIGAMLIGTGLGLILRSWPVAFAASIILPLGLWFVLGAVDALEPVQAWLTPYANVRNLLAGDMSAGKWVQWLVVFLLWSVGLNAVGAARLARGPAAAQ
jgi:hypothetical protein